jgi:TPR repeat protein
MNNLRAGSIGVLFSASLLASCGTGGVAQSVRPADPTAGSTLGEAACREGDARVDPLVVDWKPDQRGDLEVAMKEGLAVVSYSCKKGVQILRDCKVEGSYGFLGMTKKEQVVRLENSDEVAANLPTAGIGLIGKVGAEMQRGATIDIAMILVGKKRTTPTPVTRDLLKGECEGATHYLRGASVGAFVMETGTKAKVKTAVELFGAGVAAGSESSKATRNKEGDPSDCAKSSPDSSGPPGQCGAPVRLELGPIKPAAAAAADAPAQPAAAAAPAAADKDVNEGCPKGLVFTNGKCAAPESAPAFQCHEGNAAECREQCDKGNAPSCGILAAMHVRGGEGVERDDAKAAPLLKKACDGGHATSCTLLGRLTEDGRGTAKDPAAAAALYEKACNDGEALACGGLGSLLLRGEGVGKDEARAATVLKKACDGGDPRACGELGMLTVAKDPTAAGPIFRRGCQGGDPVSCNESGRMLETGQGGMGRNDMLAAISYERGCYGRMSRGYGPAQVCTSAARMKQLQGNAMLAQMFANQGCMARDSLGCAILKVALGKPAVVVPDVQQSSAWRDACVRGDGLACAANGMVSLGSGNPNGKMDLEQGCRLQNKWACEMKKFAK